MKLTKKGEYALRTLIRLGVAHRSGQEVVSVSSLAESEKLPFKFLEQILFTLRGAGYVESKRGKAGGAFLAKPQDQIHMGEIVRLIDGKLAPICCASETEYERCTCPDEEHCGLRMLMIDVRNAIANILDRYTIHDVVEVTLQKMARDGLPVLPAVRSKIATKSKSSKPTARHADPSDGFIAFLTSDLKPAKR
jgi:Rrf2 family protein